MTNSLVLFSSVCQLVSILISRVETEMLSHILQSVVGEKCGCIAGASAVSRGPYEIGNDGYASA